MPIRFQDATSDVEDLAREIIAEYFPQLRNEKIKYIFDMKKRTSNGKVVLGRCQKTNELLKHFTIDESGDEEGYKYIISLDYIAWQNIVKADQVRLLRHELRHIEVDEEAKQPYKLLPHDIEDFAEEVQLNVDDVRWAERVAGLTSAIYEQMKDQEADEEE